KPVSATGYLEALANAVDGGLWHLIPKDTAALVTLTREAALVLDPPMARMVDIGVACYDVTCKGRMEIELPEGVADLSEAQRKRAFKDSRPQAVCSKNKSHSIDAMLAWRLDR